MDPFRRLVGRPGRGIGPSKGLTGQHNAVRRGQTQPLAGFEPTIPVLERSAPA
jgi:hypothetical protein